MFEVTTDDFDAEVLAQGTVIVDFFADWCGPCRALTPILNGVAQEYPDIKVVKLNIEGSQEIAQRYKVTSIPFLGVFKDGELVDSRVGFNGRPAVEDLFKRNI